MESRTFSLAVQSVTNGSSSSSKGSPVGTAAQIVTTVISCLMGRMLLLEIFTTAVLILNITLGKRTSLFLLFFKALFIYLFTYLFMFLGPHPWHMEVPRLGVKSEL